MNKPLLRSASGDEADDGHEDGGAYDRPDDGKASTAYVDGEQFRQPHLARDPQPYERAYKTEGD